MAEKTITELLVDANVIESETTTGENTAARVGQMFIDIIDSQKPFRGAWSTSNAFPSTGGRFTGGIPLAGDMWTLTVDLSVGGNFYPAGTVLMALVNTPGQTLTNWAKLANQL